MCAYVATGVWHHWLCTGDRAFVERMWPTVERAIEFVLSLRRDDGLSVWAIEPDGRPWTYALLTGTASTQHALHAPYWWLKCAVGPGEDDHPAVRRYREFLEWDIVNEPTATRVADRVLSPVLGKSIVFYGEKL